MYSTIFLKLMMNCFLETFISCSYFVVLLVSEVERKFGVSFEKERERRKDMTGPDHGIHPLANAAGKGLKTELREVGIPPATSMPRVFV